MKPTLAVILAITLLFSHAEAQVRVRESKAEISGLLGAGNSIMPLTDSGYEQINYSLGGYVINVLYANGVGIQIIYDNRVLTPITDQQIQDILQMNTPASTSSFNGFTTTGPPTLWHKNQSKNIWIRTGTPVIWARIDGTMGQSPMFEVFDHVAMDAYAKAMADAKKLTPAPTSGGLPVIPNSTSSGLH